MNYIFKFVGYACSNWVNRTIDRIRTLKYLGIHLQEGQVIDELKAVTLGHGFSMAPHCKLLARESDAKIKIGKNVALNFNVMINADFGGEITIKDNVIIGPNVVMRASDHIVEPNKTYRHTGHEHGSITIEENVWIGGNVFIAKDVKIGQNSIIGAGSVVNIDIPANSVAQGVPARVVRKLRS
jgi:acetyltransferase-like isoleucine patch superfamily enzyme